MHTFTASQARASLYRLIDEAATTHEPVVITGKRNNVYGLLPACKHFTFLTVGSTAHVYPASELGSIARAIMGYSRV